MPLKSEIRDLGETQELLASSRFQINNSAVMLENASETFSQLRELTVQAANGTTTSQDRQAMVGEIDQLLAQLSSSANSKWGDKFVFAGSKTNAPPFGVITDGGGSRIEYRGDQNTTSVRVTAGVTTELNIPGDRIFLARDRQPTTFSGNTGAAPSGAADSGVGYGELDISFAGLNFGVGTTGVTQGDSSTTALGDITYTYTGGSPATVSLNGGPAQTVNGGVQSFTVGAGADTISLDFTGSASPTSGTITSTALMTTDGGSSTVLVDDFSGSTPYQARNSFDGTVLNVDVTSMARTGAERVKFEGTFDPFTTILAIRDILTNTSGNPDGVVASQLAEVLGEIDDAHDSVLSGLQEMGYRSENLSLFESRLSELEVSRRESLSNLEDTDFSEAIIRLNQQEISFQASLSIGARAVQTTLLNFI